MKAAIRFDDLHVPLQGTPGIGFLFDVLSVKGCYEMAYFCRCFCRTSMLRFICGLSLLEISVKCISVVRGNGGRRSKHKWEGLTRCHCVSLLRLWGRDEE